MARELEPKTPSAADDGAAAPATYLGAFERLQAQLQHDFTALADRLDNWHRSLGSGVFTPLADLEETDDAFLVEIELAGIKRGDIDISASGRRLTVSGERKEKERVGILRRRTRTVGKFRYEIELPGDFDPDTVEAGLEQGVLTVKLPKPEKDRARRIKVG